MAQAVSGLPWTAGTAGGPPVPVGLSIADHLASCQLALGVAALLARRERTGQGGLVETSLLESVLDFQFELLSVSLSEPSFQPRRGGIYSANAYLAAPYGVYPTSDGYLAIAMNPVPRLGSLIGLEALTDFEDPASWSERRDEIAALLGDHLSTQPTQHWLDLLEPADIWCAPVLTLSALAGSEAFASIAMVQEVSRPSEAGTGPPVTIRTTRSPLRIDGDRLTPPAGAPRIGQHSAALRAEFAAPGAPGTTREGQPPGGMA